MPKIEKASRSESSAVAPTDLVECADCGRLMSPRAVRCPHPQCAAFRVLCKVCSRAIPAGDMIGNRPGFTFHRRCIEGKFKIPRNVTCPDCRKALHSLVTLEQLVKRLDHCPSCGSPWPLLEPAKCGDCGLPIYSFQKTVREMRRGYEIGDPIHLFCRPDQESKNAEDQRKTRERTRGIQFATAMSLLGLICGTFGFFGVLFTHLIPLGPIAFILGLLATRMSDRYSESLPAAGWAMAIGILDSLACLGGFLSQ